MSVNNPAEAGYDVTTTTTASHCLVWREESRVKSNSFSLCSLLISANYNYLINEASYQKYYFALEPSYGKKQLCARGYPNGFQNYREKGVQTNRQTDFFVFI